MNPRVVPSERRVRLVVPRVDRNPCEADSGRAFPPRWSNTPTGLPDMATTDRILTTHVGSLPRPAPVVDLLFAQDRGQECDDFLFNEVMQQGVDEVVRLQVDAGIDVISDGEMSKISYATYIRHD